MANSNGFGGGPQRIYGNSRTGLSTTPVGNNVDSSAQGTYQNTARDSLRSFPINNGNPRGANNMPRTRPPVPFQPGPYQPPTGLPGGYGVHQSVIEDYQRANRQGGRMDPGYMGQRGGYSGPGGGFGGGPQKPLDPNQVGPNGQVGNKPGFGMGPQKEPDLNFLDFFAGENFGQGGNNNNNGNQFQDMLRQMMERLNSQSGGQMGRLPNTPGQMNTSAGPMGFRPGPPTPRYDNQGGGYGGYMGGQSPGASRYRPPTMNGDGSWNNDPGGYNYNLPNGFGSYPGYGQGNPYNQGGPGTGGFYPYHRRPGGG